MTSDDGQHDGDHGLRDEEHLFSNQDNCLCDGEHFLSDEDNCLCDGEHLLSDEEHLLSDEDLAFGTEKMFLSGETISSGIETSVSTVKSMVFVVNATVCESKMPFSQGEAIFGASEVCLISITGYPCLSLH